MESIHDVLRSLIDAAHRSGGMSEEDFKAAHEFIAGDDPETARLADEAEAAKDAADRAEYDRLSQKYAGQAPEQEAAPTAEAGGGFHQETPGTDGTGFVGGA